MEDRRKLSKKEQIVKLSYQLIRGLEHVFFVFPMKKNRIMFQSFGHADGYSCNPKYLCEYLKAHYPGQFELMWTFAHPERFTDIEGIRTVKLKTLKWLYYRLTSKVVVLNEGPSAYVAKRKGQYVIQTWHGGGAYKKVGFARDDQTPLWLWIYERTGKDIDLFLASSELSGRTSAWETYHYTGEIFKSGTPRNDLLLHPEERDRAAKTVREKLGIDADAYVVLYAPTFRNLNENPEDVFSFRKLQAALERRTGRKTVFLQRLHRYNRGAVETDAPTINVTEYPDMQELLCAADMLITDYSSCLWDFALLERPCLLYVPDLQQYIGARGFFTPIEEWSGIVCRTADALYAAAENLDEVFCAEKARAHLKKHGCYETGHASEQVAARILAVTGVGRKEANK